MREEIGLGDLVRALAALDLLAEDAHPLAQRVARALGVRSEASSATAPERTTTRSASLDINITGRAAIDVVAVTDQATATLSSARPQPAATVVPGPLSIERAPRVASPQPPALPALPPPPDDEREPRLPIEPLFSPASSRSLLASALATVQPEGAIDLDRLIEQLAHGRTVARVPRRPRLTVRRSVQLLVDHGPGLDPFARDVAALVEQLRALAGPYRIDALRFAGDPRRAGRGPRRTWTTYRAPEAGARVLAITDLGIAAPRVHTPAPTAAWLEIAARIADAGGSLVCIVPYPPARWPAALAGPLSIVAWDRATTVAQVRRLLRGRR